MKVNWNELNIYISLLFSLVYKELNGMKSNFVWELNQNGSFCKKKKKKKLYSLIKIGVYKILLNHILFPLISLNLKRV